MSTHTERKRVRTFTVRCYCDEPGCSGGELKDPVSVTRGPEYHYICPECGTRHTLRTLYPYQETEVVE